MHRPDLVRDPRSHSRAGDEFRVARVVAGARRGFSSGYPTNRPCTKAAPRRSPRAPRRRISSALLDDARARSLNACNMTHLLNEVCSKSLVAILQGIRVLVEGRVEFVME